MTTLAHVSADPVAVTGRMLQGLARHGCDIPTDEDTLRQVAWLTASILSRIGCLGDLPGEPLTDTELASLRERIEAGRQRRTCPRDHLTAVPTQRAA